MTTAFNSNQERKKKYAILGVSSILLVAMVACVAVGINSGAEVGSEGSSDNHVTKSQKNVKASTNLYISN